MQEHTETGCCQARAPTRRTACSRRALHCKVPMITGNMHAKVSRAKCSTDFQSRTIRSLKIGDERRSSVTEIQEQRRDWSQPFDRLNSAPLSSPRTTPPAVASTSPQKRPTRGLATRSAASVPSSVECHSWSHNDRKRRQQYCRRNVDPRRNSPKKQYQ